MEEQAETRVLLIENDKQEAYYISDLLDYGEGGYNLTTVTTFEQGMDRLKKSVFDVILLDFDVIVFSIRDTDTEDFSALAEIREHHVAQPVIVLTSIDHENIALKAMQEGAQDYLVKDKLNKNALVKSIAYAIERNRLVLQLEEKTALLEEVTKELAEKNKELQRLAVTDALTGLTNRRQFRAVFAKEYEKAKRYSLPLSCLMIDVDHFKEVNDTYGHQCGDTVLVRVGTLLRETTRLSDTVGRYGGEEFIVIAQISEHEAVAFAEKLRTRLAAETFSCGEGEPFSITVSVGIAHYAYGVESDDALVRLADDALYRAKENGRNRVEVYRENTEGRF